MKIKGIQKSELFESKFRGLDKAVRDRIENAMKKLQLAFLQASTPNELPQPLNKASNTKPFRRAEVTGDLRIYWHVEKEIMIFHDICDHKQAKAYKDVHK
jgi:hypothetical protein